MRSHASSKRLLAALICALALLPAGCNNGRRLQADLYQRELRLQEDEIYRLEDHLAEYQAILADTRCELEQAKRDLAANQSTSSGATPRGSTRAPGEASRSTPTLAAPATAADAAPVSPPEVEFVDPPKASSGNASEPPPFKASPDTGEAPRFEAPKFESPATPSQPGGEAPRFEPDALDAAPPEASNVPLRFRSPNEPQPLVLATATQPLPIRAESRAASDGAAIEVAYRPAPAALGGSLAVRVTPTAGPSPTSFAGPLSVLLVEAAGGATPAVRDSRGPSPSDRRLARWDFSAAEVAEATDRDGTIALAVALPRPLVTAGTKRLWVRMSHGGGQHTVAGAPVCFDLPQSTRYSIDAAEPSGDTDPAAWRRPATKAVAE